jgi:hypothetical protein
MAVRTSKSPICPGLGLAVGVPPRGADYPISLSGTSGAVAFYRADIGYVGGAVDGGRCEQFDDRWTNALHATQATGAKQAVLDTSTYSRPCLSFFAGQVMEIAAGLAPLMPANGWTIWAVRKLATTAGNQASIAVGATGGYALTNEGVTERIRHQGVGTVNDGASTTDLRFLLAQRDSGTDRMCINGSQVTMSASGGTGTPSGASAIGALLADLTFPSNADIFECGFMSRLLSGGNPGVGNPVTGECAQLRAYIQSRYGI